MAQESNFTKAEQIDIPLESFEDETANLNDTSAPPDYQSPRIDFNQGWKDRGFAFTFWIYLIGVLVASLVLGIPAIQSYIEHMKIHGKPTVLDVNMTLLLYLFVGTIATASLMSFVMFFFLQLCAGRMIMFSLIFMILIQIGLVVFILMTGLFPAIVLPLIILVLTIVFVFTIRKRIKFAETNIQIACAVLRQHPTLLLVAIFMLILQVLWFICWSLLVLGTLHAIDHPLFDRFINRLTLNSSVDVQTTTFKKPYGYDTTLVSKKQEDNDWHSNVVSNVILFLSLFIWYWAAMTFANIVHFISACAVGHWWFPIDTNQQYRINNGIKRAFSTNLGTISFGSLLEAFIKALRGCINNKRNNIINACAYCILSIIEKLIGYINEWAFVYSALTGQSFIQAGKSFFSLLTKRGWTLIINDSIIGNCLALVNFIVGLTTAFIIGLCCYFFFSTTSEKLLPTILIVACTGFALGTILNATLTTVLKSCVRAAFVCFALNPAALGATHPDYLQRLTDVWHEFYPNEFATSGYANQFPKVASVNYV